MSVADKLRGLFGGGAPPKIKVHVMIKGRIGEGWYDVDRVVKLPQGTTLAQLVEQGASRGLPLREAIDDSPHLADTLMWNGERAPVESAGGRELADGDQIYLLAPLAGG